MPEASSVGCVIDGLSAMVDVLQSPLACARALGADILAVICACPDAQWADLKDAAKLMCDNLSQQVAIYSFFGEFVRALQPHTAGLPDEIQQRFRELKIKVMGD